MGMSSQVSCSEDSMKIAVTGANGFLGIGGVEELARRGNDVVAVDRAVDRIVSRAFRRACSIWLILMLKWGIPTA